MGEEEDKEKNISLNDLASLRNIVNVASRRGAFGAEEFEDVGKIYSKLDNFLKEQAKLLEEQNVNKEEGSSIEEAKVD
tara:strand:+ start:226 stop:459 length:234 start_codon:yes stop_codon:yes gene_type:complete